MAEARTANPLPIKQATMSIRNFLLPLLAIGFTLAISSASAREEPKPPVPAVQVVFAESYDVARRYQGRVQAPRRATLSFLLPGRVSRLRVDIGDHFEVGDVLAELDDRTYRARVRSADAQREQAEAQVDVARADLKLARLNAERSQALRSEGHVSQHDVDQANLSLEGATARVQAAQAAVGVAKTRMWEAEIAITDTKIRAPWQGSVSRRHLDEGALTTPQTPVLEAEERAPLEIEIGVPVPQARRLQRGFEYEVVVGDHRISAQLRSLSSVVDTRSRTQLAVFSAPTEWDGIPNTVAELVLTHTIHEPSMTLPVTALSADLRGLWGVYVAELTEGIYTVSRRLVHILHTDGATAQVAGGLLDGDLVITNGLHKLVSGQVVDVSITPHDQ